jgi:hypothetical protein
MQALHDWMLDRCSGWDARTRASRFRYAEVVVAA